MLYYDSRRTETGMREYDTNEKPDRQIVHTTRMMLYVPKYIMYREQYRRGENSTNSYTSPLWCCAKLQHSSRTPSLTSSLYYGLGNLV